MIIKGTDHLNYCDAYMLACKYLLQQPAILGKGIDPIEVVRNLDMLIISFFYASDDDIVVEKELLTTPEVLVDYLSCNIANFGSRKSTTAFKCLQNFIHKNIVHESSMDACSDSTTVSNLSAMKTFSN